MPRQLSHGNWLNLLDDIKTYLSSDDYVNIHQKRQRRKGFISYAWERDAEKNKVLQSWLSDLRNDLKHAALTEGIFLDIFNMHGDVKDSMLTGLKTSDVIFFICNPRFKARLAEECGLVQMTEQPTTDKINALKLAYTHVYVRVRGSVNELYFKSSWEDGNPANITPKSRQALDEFDKTIAISSATHRQLTTKELQTITAITGRAYNNLAFEVHTVLQEAAKRQAQGQEPLKIIAILQAGDKASALPEQLEAYPLVDFTQLPDDRQQDGYHKRITGFRKSSGLIPYVQEIQEADVDYTRILYRHYLSVVPRAPRLFGREDELKSLNSLVTNNGVSFLQGDQGVGASTLAQNFAALCYQPSEQRIAQHSHDSQHYPVVRYLNTKEQDFDGLTKEIAQELAVSHENWWDELLALPVPWLMVLDGDVRWEPGISDAQHRLLRVQTTAPTSASPAATLTPNSDFTATSAPNPAYVITLAPLGDEARLQMVRYYLTGSNELKDEHALIKKYVAVGSLYSALEYIKNSPWLNLAQFLKYRLEYKQQHANSLMHQTSTVTTQATNTQSDVQGVADGAKSKWSVLKAGIKKILAERLAPQFQLKILAARADMLEAQKLHQDLSQSGVDGVAIVYLDNSAQSQQISAEITKGVALIIIATPNLKKELEDKAYSDELERAIRENIDDDKVAPLVVKGDFKNSVESTFLSRYLVRFANTQIDYEKMLIALQNPIGIIPKFYELDKDEHYKSHCYDYLLTNLPDDISKYVGRSELLVNMHKALTDIADKTDKTNAVAITTSSMAITSMGGVGKSTLALMYGYKYLQAHCYDFVRFLNAEGDVLKSSLITLAGDLGIITQNTKFDEILAGLQARLAQIPRYLLILDNVTKHEDIAEYYDKLKTLPGQHILVTSRDSAGWGAAIALNVFSENEALEYLQKELNLTGFRLMLSTPMHDDDIAHQVLFIYVQNNVLSYAARNQNAQVERRELLDNELPENLVTKLKSIVFQQKSLNEYSKAEQELLVDFSKQIQLPLVAGRELVAELGYLPLALSAAVAVIKDKCRNGVAAEEAIAEYLRDLRNGTLDRSANPVMRSLNLSLLKISGDSDALKLLRYCAFLSPEYINPQWFGLKGLLEQEESGEEPQLGGAMQEEVSEDTAKIMQRVYDAIAVIVHFSLVTVKDCELMMHRLMQEAIRRSFTLNDSDILEQYLLPLKTELLKIYPWNKLKMGDYELAKRLTLHFLQLNKHLTILTLTDTTQIAASEIAQAELLAAAANAFGALGDYAQQRELLEKVLVIREKHYGSEHVEYAHTLGNLANALGSLGDYAKKRELLEKVLVVMEKHYGTEHVKYAITLHDLANALGSLGDYAKQRELLEKALVIKEKHYGTEHVEYARTLSSLAQALGSLGNYAKQRELLEKVLVIEEKHYGTEHVEYARTLSGLAQALGSLGNYAKKRELLAKALVIKEKHYGTEHFSYAATLYHLAQALGSLGDYAGQRELLEKVLLIRGKHYGTEHVRYAGTLNDLANTLGSLGDYAKKRELLEKVLVIKEKHYGTEHVEHAKTLAKLAGAIGTIGNNVRKIEMLEQVLKVLQVHYQPEHSDVGSCLRSLGRAYVEVGNFDKAKELLTQAVTIKENAYGKEHVEYARTIHSLARVFIDLKDYSRAQELLTTALVIKDKAYGKKHPQYGKTLYYLAKTQESLGEFIKAAELLKEVINIYSKFYGQEHFRTEKMQEELRAIEVQLPHAYPPPSTVLISSGAQEFSPSLSERSRADKPKETGQIQKLQRL